MQQVKDFLNVLDLLVGTLWSITVIDIMPLVITGGILDKSLLDASSIVNLLLAIAGLVYLIARIIHFLRMSKLHLEYKKQEIIEKQIKNFNEGITTELKQKSK